MISLVKIFFTFVTLVTICNCATVINNNNWNLTGMRKNEDTRFVRITVSELTTFTGVILHQNYIITTMEACKTDPYPIVTTWNELQLIVEGVTPGHKICIIKTNDIQNVVPFILRVFQHHLKGEKPMKIYNREITVEATKLKSKRTRELFKGSYLLGVESKSNDIVVKEGSALIYQNKKNNERLVAIVIGKKIIENKLYIVGVEFCLKEVAEFIKTATNQAVKCRKQK